MMRCYIAEYGPHAHAYYQDEYSETDSAPRLAVRIWGKDLSNADVSYWLQSARVTTNALGRLNSLVDWLVGVPEEVRESTPGRTQRAQRTGLYRRARFCNFLRRLGSCKYRICVRA